MAVQSVPSGMGVTKAPYASFAGKVPPAVVAYSGFLMGESVVGVALVGKTKVKSALAGDTIMEGAISGTAGYE